MSEYIKYADIGLAALVRAGKVQPAMRLARKAHDEVDPRIKVVIEFYEEAAFIAPAHTGHFDGMPFLGKKLGTTEAGRLQEKGSRQFKGYRFTTDSFFLRRARAAGLKTMGRATTSELGAASSDHSQW
ncbi:hypothetical protein [Mesorhizobium sp.]|uniref:hypothetical protein n=1 Tax=Mesorhizobium sp. TaxID=1871066 RepID=UPI0025C572C8|nr:hypothetical protein [Mesorhizobium sp.]